MASLSKRFDGKTVLQLVGQRLLRWVHLNFKEGGAEEKWPALSPNTIASRRAGRITKAQGATKYRGRTVVGSAIGLSGAQPLRDTGRLEQSFTSKVMSETTVEVGTQSQIAEYHQNGVGPFVITPRRAKLLFFMTAGGPAFAKRVNHPGIPKRPMLPSDNLTMRLGTEILQALADKAVQAVG